MARLSLLAGAGALALGLATLGTAQAAVLSNVSNTPLSLTTPVTISLNSGAATLVFTGLNNFLPDAAVRTTGTARVTTIFGGLADFGAGSTIDGTAELYTFAAYPTATEIPNSPADDYIGFSFTQADGTHYGYAEVFGTSLVGYGYEAAANTTILTGATGGAALAPIVGTGVTATPEPATAALLLSGLATLTMVRRRKS